MIHQWTVAGDSRMAMFSRLFLACLNPTSQQSTCNHICQATCSGCPLFPGCPAGCCSPFSWLLPSRLFSGTLHWTENNSGAWASFVNGGGVSIRTDIPSVCRSRLKVDDTLCLHWLCQRQAKVPCSKFQVVYRFQS